ncbi:hypothetical protein OF83DRAFT_1180605 [Amylostereum chailletii]|nr:hypothetical protein OF83DRAFT_1180605 [Amylostereum chailletii]
MSSTLASSSRNLSTIDRTPLTTPPPSPVLSRTPMPDPRDEELLRHLKQVTELLNRLDIACTMKRLRSLDEEAMQESKQRCGIKGLFQKHGPRFKSPDHATTAMIGHRLGSPMIDKEDLKVVEAMLKRWNNNIRNSIAWFRIRIKRANIKAKEIRSTMQPTQ